MDKPISMLFNGRPPKTEKPSNSYVQKKAQHGGPLDESLLGYQRNLD
jgi:hypothetical protein